MFRTFLPSVGAVMVASALSGVFTASPVMAATDYPVFDRASVKATIQPDAIHVIARGEDSYTAIREKNLTYNVRVRLNMARGRLRNYTISPTEIAASAGNQGATFRARGLSEVRERHTLNIPLRGSGNIRNHIIAQCNNLLAKGADESRRHETTVELPVTLSAVAGRRGEDGGRNRRILEVTGSATARVICNPVRRARPAAVTEVFLDAPERVGKFCPQDVSLKTWVFSDKPGEFSFRVVREDGSASQPYKIVTERHNDGKVFAQTRYTFTTKRPVDERFRVEVDGQKTSSSWLRVNVPCRRKPEQVAAFAVEDSTVKVKQSNSNSCPQTVVLTTRVRTNRPGKVKFRMEDDSGWTSDTFTTRSVERPNGRFVAVHERKVYFKQSQRKRYRVIVNGLRGASKWREVNVRCKVASVPLKVTSMGMNADIGRGNRCPREGSLRGWFLTNKPGPVRFHVAWGNGRHSKSIALKSVREADGRFVARFKRPVRFDLPVNWRMRTELEGQKLASKWIPVQVRCGTNKPQQKWQNWQEKLLRKLEEGAIKSQR